MDGSGELNKKVELDKNMIKEKNLNKESSTSEVGLSFRERAFSAGGAAFISAVVINPHDVAKVLFLKFSCYKAVQTLLILLHIATNTVT